MLDGLNKEQIEAVKHIDGPCLVIAGAGSGKTKVLTTRIAYLIDNGISDNNILAITFTNKAAREMRERLNILVPDNHVFVGTFHSFGLKVLRENLSEVGLDKNFTIIDSDDVLSLIKRIMKEQDVDVKEISPYYVRSKISFIKNELLTEADIDKYFVSPIEKRIIPIYKEYVNVLKRNNSVDFDDLLLLPTKLFKTNKEVLDRYQEHYKYILIDEYQDTNEVQYKMSKLLALKYRNIFCVGDANQCVVRGTKINTLTGTKNVEDITLDDKILTACGFGKVGYQKIDAILPTKYEGKVVSLKTKLGYEVTCTLDHKLFVKVNKIKCTNKIEIYYFGNSLHHSVIINGENYTKTNSMEKAYQEAIGYQDSFRKEIIEKFRLTDKAFKIKKAHDIKAGDIIPVCRDNIIVEDQVIKIDFRYYNDYVYDISVPTTRNFIANNICVHNCIYGFRGSNFRNILNFEKDYSDAKVVALEQNYRSTKTILDAANSVIKNNKERKDMELFSNLGVGDNVKYMRSYDEKHEVALIVDEIKKLLTLGYKYSDIAIFYRTNAQSRNIEEVMLKNNFPYKVFGSFYFYNRKEIKDLICYLRLINNTNDDISLRRVINTPKRKIGPKSVEDLANLAKAHNISMFQAISSGKELEFKNLIIELQNVALNLSLTELIDVVLDKSGMKKELESEKTLDSELRLENLMEFKSITASFEARTGSVNLGDFLEEISLVADISEHEDGDDVITLMTLHSAKGLEFKVVFITGMEEGIFPHQNAFNEGDEGIEEERRLCYVGFTRAKEKLYLTNAKKRMLYGKTTCNAPSRFIDEIKKDILEISNMSIKEEKFVNKEEMYTNEDVEFNKGDIVIHTIYGRGVVIDVDERFVSIAFARNFGVRKLLKNHKGLKKLN